MTETAAERLATNLVGRQAAINRELARNGVRFGIYKDGEYHDRLFPYDPIPRVIASDEFDRLEAGLKQRVDALNAFLRDVYSDKRIVHDGVVPEEFVYSSPGYLPQVNGVTPPAGIYAHIAGEDLVQGVDGRWWVLEDNLRIPSGASYPLFVRDIERHADPVLFRDHQIRDNRDYPRLLRRTLDFVSTEGVAVVLSPGRYNSAFFEHAYLAEKTGATLAFPEDLEVMGNKVYLRDYAGRHHRVGVVYRRLSDDYLDPFAFNPDSLIGVPGILAAYRAGNVAIVNAPGNGVADDKGIYYFVPEMVRHYLHEEPILQNAPTYLPFFEKDRREVLDRLGELVIKDVSEAGGYGVVFGSSLDRAARAELAERIEAEPRRFIAQEVIDFRDIDAVGDAEGELSPRKCDLRAFVLTGHATHVWYSGLTRYSSVPGQMIVNSSQGGGFKDTWVLAPAGGTRRDATPGPCVDALTEACRARVEALGPGAGAVERAAEVMHEVFAAFTYTPGSTTVDTTAEQALAQRRGVCQDYAHVMLAVCRHLGLTARYIAGMLDGEGATHAWVEVYDERGVWVGLDPTHDRPAGDTYIVIGHGRDYRDTKIDIGLFTGAGVSQTQWVNASVHEVGA